MNISGRDANGSRNGGPVGQSVNMDKFREDPQSRTFKSLNFQWKITTHIAIRGIVVNLY